MKKLCFFLSIMFALTLMVNFNAIAIGPLQPEDIVRTSSVSTVVTYNDTEGTWTYNYTVENTSPDAPQWVWGETPVWPLIIDYEVPLDSPEDVSDIDSPDIWDYEFISYSEYNNPFGAPWVLHWYDTEPPEPPNNFEAARAIAPDGYTTWVENF